MCMIVMDPYIVNTRLVRCLKHRIASVFGSNAAMGGLRLYFSRILAHSETVKSSAAWYSISILELS